LQPNVLERTGSARVPRRARITPVAQRHFPRATSRVKRLCAGIWRRARSEQEVSVAKEDRGFASMDRSKQREIASKGGKAAHQKGTAHEWTSEEAREAGRKGGMASHRRRRQMMDTPGETPQTEGSTDRPDASGDDQGEPTP
jgi:general stress protein YciG